MVIQKKQPVPFLLRAWPVAKLGAQRIAKPHSALRLTVVV